jgi:hypothetical protein
MPRVPVKGLRMSAVGSENVALATDNSPKSWRPQRKAFPESPTRVTALSRGVFIEAIRSEDVPVGTPNRSITVERESVDEDGGLG